MCDLLLVALGGLHFFHLTLVNGIRDYTVLVSASSLNSAISLSISLLLSLSVLISPVGSLDGPFREGTFVVAVRSRKYGSSHVRNQYGSKSLLALSTNDVDVLD